MQRKIGFLTQGLFGGTDRILEDFCNWLNDKNYNAIILNDDQQHALHDVDLIVLPTSEIFWLWENRKNINKNCQIMIWCMGHDALQAYFYNESIQNRIYKKIFSCFYTTSVKNLINKNVLTYTDLIAENLDLNNLKMPLVTKSTNIYPIPISIPALQVGSITDKDNPLQSLFWLGRVDCDFKVWSLLALLADLDSWVNKTKSIITFSIIGDGDGIDLIDDSQYSFEIKKLGSLKYKQMEMVLQTEAHLVFAMGTSALEGARQSVPTVIVKPLKEKELDITYRWVFNSIGYSLGEFNNAFIYPKQTVQTLDSILELFLTEPEKMKFESYNYAKKFNRNYIYSSILNPSYDRPSFSYLKNSLFVPYLSGQLKKIIRLVVNK